MRRANQIIGVIVAALLALLPASPAVAAANLEYQVKAAFLYNFAKFVSWPEDAFGDGGGPFVFCIVGTDPFGDTLEKVLKGRQASNRPIVVRRGADPESVGRCHLMFVGEGEDPRVARHLQQVAERPVLTVGESEAFSRAAGMIRLLVQDKRVRFDINVKAAAKARLKMSSQLLKLARRVIH